MSESQFNYLFTLKNAHLSLSSYNFRMQPNIPMKFAVYVAWILLCKLCKFGEKIYYYSGDIKFFLGDYFFLARPPPCSNGVYKMRRVGDTRLLKLLWPWNPGRGSLKVIESDIIR